MTNVLQHRNVLGIEWTVEIPPYFGSVKKSEHFRLQNRKCYLKFEIRPAFGVAYLRIVFETGEDLNPTTEVFVTCYGSMKLHSEKHHIKCQDQVIWTWIRGKDVSLQNTLLTFVVTASLSRDDKSTQTPSFFDSSICLKIISSDFFKLLNEGPNHDVQFICEDQTFLAHKNVLCCRSSVFNSMFHTDMLEGNTGQVKIQDMNATIFQQFLRSLYTGMLPELTVDTAVQFYKASDKYAIDAMKKQCTVFLLDHLSRENAFEILILADKHSDSCLKKIVMAYILKEKLPLIGENWTDFCRENKDLAIEVLNFSYRCHN